jgi:hypothetical protein
LRFACWCAVALAWLEQHVNADEHAVGDGRFALPSPAASRRLT